ncbi:hypothetical protein AMTRI_Chr09g21700 [Amborella trichopoda]|uniref:Myeloid leukemia factor n=1 Tax=Amborella trichopoda TaxID=13333 RepID=W1PYY5_AMBTC|nr:myeloid leukemia factor 1 [Amborella trichopoda]XP_011626060.1 myeloid leukemia factor 1 [Amborella trichopoda]XP_020527484.1 myeloid leukemia factor 1 [Amborella trichopoda]ERN13329.1 hypothetical protein AMTR_s00041p00099130 [Amborella trichopoda]|eukprot:XP_006851862.1 myeloid leukemia factor 1 [Amborella trichopoda]
MQRGRARDDFFGFGDPFADFGGSFGFGNPRSLMSSFFGRDASDPFNDPFFTRPFGSMFGPSFFNSPFGNPESSAFIEHQQAPQVQSQSRQGPIIQELSSDEDDKAMDEEDRSNKQARLNKTPNVQHPDEEGQSRNSTNFSSYHKQAGLNKTPYVQHLDDEGQDNKARHMQQRSDYSRLQAQQPQIRSYSFQSSKVTYGGVNGAYYTSSTSRRTGSDGVTEEEHRKADTTTGKATHRVSKGLKGKGHSVTRKLKSDGNVDTMQMLHNLNEDELADFEEEWKGSARKHLPGWKEGPGVLGSGQQNMGVRQGYALPSIERRKSKDQAHGARGAGPSERF